MSRSAYGPCKSHRNPSISSPKLSCCSKKAGPTWKGMGTRGRQESSLKHVTHLSQLAVPHNGHRYRIIVIWAEKVNSTQGETTQNFSLWPFRLGGFCSMLVTPQIWSDYTVQDTSFWQRCFWRFKASGMWRCVIGCVVPKRSAGSRYVRLQRQAVLEAWRWRHCDPSKCWQLHMQRHSVTPWIFRH
jgi:hypothetical protein